MSAISRTCFAIAALCCLRIASAQPSIEPVEMLPDGAKAASTLTISRVKREQSATGTLFRHQWPGTYFETAFKGSAIYFRLGAGEVILHVRVDDEAATPMIKPAPGIYEIRGLSAGTHRVRIEVATESQASANEFGGFYLPPTARSARIKPRARQIEFIGDSHTVGYGNTSDSRECTEQQVWMSTDTSQAFGPLIARHFDADYQINAISGRGIVRNYNGGAGDPLPQAYPLILFDRADPYHERRWRPEWIVISLGTNDFSTQLHEGEPWRSREELHAAFESTFVNFIRQLRERNPRAQLVVWATDSVNPEIREEAQKVVTQLQTSGEKNIGFVPIPKLSMTGCHWHPSTADDHIIADALIEYIETHDRRWKRR